MEFIIPKLPNGKIGVYRMVIDDKWFYIGSSKDLKSRFCQWKNIIKHRNKNITVRILSALKEESVIRFEIIDNLSELDDNYFIEHGHLVNIKNTPFCLNMVFSSSKSARVLSYINSGKIIQLKRGKVVKTYTSITEAAINLGISSYRIQAILNGSMNKIRQYTFKYA